MVCRVQRVVAYFFCGVLGESRTQTMFQLKRRLSQGGWLLDETESRNWELDHCLVLVLDPFIFKLLIYFY